jgi:hypothetical protein
MAKKASSRRQDHGPVRLALEAWLPDGLEGADGVRGEVARRLAAELDDGELAPYVVPRIAQALVLVVAEIEAEAVPASALDVKRMLREVLA